MSEPRCEMSELLVSQCACRVHVHAETEIDAERRPTGGFVAKYDGQCIECQEEIRAGVDVLVFSALSGWVHEECAD